jgi:hypothetical protein
MEHLQETVQEGIGLNGGIFTSELVGLFMKIKETKAFEDANRELALYYAERMKVRPFLKQRGKDHTKGGYD